MPGLNMSPTQMGEALLDEASRVGLSPADLSGMEPMTRTRVIALARSLTMTPTEKLAAVLALIEHLGLVPEDVRCADESTREKFCGTVHELTEPVILG